MRSAIFIKAMYNRKRILLISLLVIFLLGLLPAQHFTIPVLNASSSSYHPKSFWYYPWGKSGTHKGVDLFAAEGTPVVSSTGGIVVFTGELELGGKVVLILGPKWRLHYYAHLKEIKTGLLHTTTPGEIIGSVGTTGNAKGKPPHLHYSILTLIPYPWKIDASEQGWKKMFYLNPITFLNQQD